MRKYFNLALIIPIVLLAASTLKSNMNIVSAVVALLIVGMTIKSTVTDEKSAIQLFPSYIAGAMFTSLALWIPALIANRNAEIYSIAGAIERISQNPNKELIPILVAVVISVLSGILSGVIKKPHVSDVLAVVRCNAICIAVITTILNGTYLEKLSVIICVITLIYSMLYEKSARLSNASLCGLIIAVNLFGTLAYFLASSYIEFSLAPKIIQHLTGKNVFYYVFGILVYMLATHFISLKGVRLTSELKSINAGAVTLVLLYTVYSFIKYLYPEKYFIWIAVLLILGSCIFFKASSNGRYLYTNEYIYSLVLVAIDIIFVALFLGRRDLCLKLFSSDIIFYITAAFILASAIFVHPRTSYGLMCLGIATISASIGYSFNIWNIVLLAAITVVGFLHIRKINRVYIYSCALLLILALIPTYFLSPNANVFIYTDAVGAAGAKNLENSLLCVMQKDSDYSKGDIKVIWDDGEVIENQGFTKIFTRVKPSQKMRVETENMLGIKRKQTFSYVTDGVWQPPVGAYSKIENGHDVLKIVEYDKSALSEKDLPIKKGAVIEDGNVYITGKNICISMANRKNAKAIEYIIVDSENNVLSDGYVANRAYIDVAFPTIPEGSRLLAIATDESYNTVPVTAWNIVNQ